MSIICVKNHKVLDLPFSFVFHLPLRLLYSLDALEEDVVRADLGASSG
jgi:uncharacterized protein YceK